MTTGTKPRVVFVVDDEVVVADTISLILRAAGFQVVTFYDGSDVLEWSAQESIPDVVVTDFAMPKCDGATLAVWLKEHYPTCRIVMISGNTAAVPATLSDQILRFTLLQKPVSPQRLIQVVEGKAA
jgi:DNA-binding NtrC family response regulator